MKPGDTVITPEGKEVDVWRIIQYNPETELMLKEPYILVKTKFEPSTTLVYRESELKVKEEKK